MAHKTRKGAGAQSAADPKHEQEHPGKTVKGKSAGPGAVAPENQQAIPAGAEEAARKKIMEEFNEREDLSERQLSNRNWL